MLSVLKLQAWVGAVLYMKYLGYDILGRGGNIWNGYESRSSIVRFGEVQLIWQSLENKLQVEDSDKRGVGILNKVQMMTGLNTKC